MLYSRRFMLPAAPGPHIHPSSGVFCRFPCPSARPGRSDTPRLSRFRVDPAALRNRCTQKLRASLKVMMIFADIPAPAVWADGYHLKGSQIALSAKVTPSAVTVCGNARPHSHFAMPAGTAQTLFPFLCITLAASPWPPAAAAPNLPSTCPLSPPTPALRRPGLSRC